MGFDLEVIKPEHWREYHSVDVEDVEDVEEQERRYWEFLRDFDRTTDPWYVDETHPDSYRVWRNWCYGQYDHNDGTSHAFPNSLCMFYHCMDIPSVLDELATLDSGEVSSFVEWARHWRAKGARFHLSC